MNQGNTDRHQYTEQAAHNPEAVNSRSRGPQKGSIPYAVPFASRNRFTRFARKTWDSPHMRQRRELLARWQKARYAGATMVIGGTLLATLLIMVLDRTTVLLDNPGLVYLPVVAMLAYHWKWRHAVVATILQLLCVYYFFIPPRYALKSLTPVSVTQLVTLAAVTGFVLGLVLLARRRRAAAEEAAGHLAALNRVGTALTSELDEHRLLHMIAETARDLTGAGFAAFTLRPTNTLGQPLVPAEGNLFYLAAVVGVSKEQEALFQRMSLGGEGLLAPVFRCGVSVLVADATAITHRSGRGETAASKEEQVRFVRDSARHAAFAYAHGLLPGEELRSIGTPRGHPVVRSFLGAPLLDRNGQVRGGLLLGHTSPNCFTREHEALLVGLAAQAAVALENARLYSAAQTQAQELDTIFESIADGITLVDKQGTVLRENRAARHLRESLEKQARGEHKGAEESLPPSALLRDAAVHMLKGETEQRTNVTLIDEHKETREYLVSASPLRPPGMDSGPQREGDTMTSPAPAQASNNAEDPVPGAVVVWHDVTEARRLLLERRAHAETEAHRALLQTVIDELPSGVYLVRGRNARLVLANRAVKEIWGAAWAYGQPMADFLKENGIRVARIDGHPLPIEEFATLRVVKNGGSVHHYQEVIRHRDGTTLPVLVNAVAIDPGVLGWTRADDPQHSSEETEPAAIVVHQDVTALKEAERLKDEFIGIAAHELRNPLAVLKGFAQTLIVQTARGRGSELADWQTEAIEAIDQATTRLVELTEDLLDVTRLQGGRLELHIVPTDLIALIRRVVTRLSIVTPSRRLSIHALTEHLVAQVDPQRIEQVLNNVINNAIKYSPEGGDIDITIQPNREMNAALISIRDQGIGIPEQQQSRIFVRFMRADNARTYGIGGTGLGLYLCRELIERHDGHIWFESVENQGSTFFISLPLSTDDSSEEEQES